MDKDTDKNDSNTKLLRVFVPTSFEGVTSVAVLHEVLNKDVQLDVQYTNHIDFREYKRFEGADMILVLGFAYMGYTLPDDFFATVDVPFMDFIHCSTYGEQLTGNHIISTVNPDMDPVKELFTFLQRKLGSTILEKHVTMTEKAQYLIDAVNAYRTWTWKGNDTTKMLLALYQASYKWLPNLLQGLSLPEIVRKYAPIIKGQLVKMDEYIESKKKMTKRYTVDIEGQTCILKVVYADQYINELANALLNEEQTADSDPYPVIVCVGRSTRSNDQLSIRTKAINAGKVAYTINRGQGKETVASVFTGVGYAELMGNAIVTSLTQNIQ